MNKFYCYLLLAINALLVEVCNALDDNQQQQQQQKRKILQQAEPRILNVTSGVWVATGYGFANMILFKGDDGLVVVDTLTYGHNARKAYQDLLQASDSTEALKAIILTHFHLDHIGGANLLKREYGNADTKIYSHRSMTYERSKYARVMPFYTSRIAQQMGKDIYPKTLPCMMREAPCLDTATVTDTIEDGDELNIAGLNFTFLHTRGETDDQLSVWLASKHLLVAADTVYSSFPNIYSLRGTPARDAFAWYHSVGRMRELNPHHLVPCHGLPIQGSFQVDIALAIYRDGIQFVHDQTVRLMNKGLHLDDIVETVKLPPLLRSRKMLNQIYGKVEWSVRGIFDNYNGWFDGNAENIFPLSRSKKAKFMQRLLSLDYQGTAYEKLLHHANMTLANSNQHFEQVGIGLADEVEWGMYLCALASEIGESEELRQIAMGITKAAVEINKDNMIAHNFYLVHLRRLQQRVAASAIPTLNPIQHLPIVEALQVIPFRFRAEICEPRLTLKLLISISDALDSTHGYIMRNCIIEHISNPDKEDFSHLIRIAASEFRQIFSKTLDPNSISINGDELKILTRFVSFLD